MRLNLGKILVLISWLIFVSGQAGFGHETDQFTTPIGREFADIGPFLNRWAFDLLDGAVQQTNREIRNAIDRGDWAHVRSLQRPEQLVDAVHGQLPWSVQQIEELEHLFLSPAMRQRYPGRLVSYREIDHNIYEHAFSPLDYRVFSRWYFASTIKVYGTYLGIDKIGHFTDMGVAYYWAWHEAREHDAPEDQALAAAVRIGTQGASSEAGWLGTLANGDYSNGDLAANYCGFLFYRNIAEVAPVKGRLRPPMVTRDGEYWRLADQVRRDSDFFAMFISDHLDEALNPGLFDESMRPALHAAVRERTRALLWRYRNPDGSPRSAEDFQGKLLELNSYWGADYGHRGTEESLVTLANSCYPEKAASFVYAAGRQPTTLHPLLLASVGGDRKALPLLRDQILKIDAPAIPSARQFGDQFSKITNGSESVRCTGTLSRDDSAVDEFGRTALHEATARGLIETVEVLLKQGANPDAADAYGTTSLHLACRNDHNSIAGLLLRAGSHINVANSAGMTPLHEAASCGDSGLAELLLANGASATARNRRHMTPADVAASRGYSQLALTLRHKADSSSPRTPR